MKKKFFGLKYLQIDCTLAEAVNQGEGLEYELVYRYFFGSCVSRGPLCSA